MAKVKQEHEEAMEDVKHLLDKGIGMGEIKEKTGLTEHNISKVKNNVNKKWND